MIINLELYRTFIAVAEQGSFTRAANELGLTQSAISQAVRQLEELLDAQLFIRTGRGIILTDAGEILISRVGELISGVNSAQNYFMQLRGLEAGSLRIGASDTLSRHILLPHLCAFHERYPKVGMQVTNRTSEETVELLRRGKVDIGFVNLPVECGKELVVEELLTVQDCFICGLRYVADFKEPVSLEKLAGYPLLLLERASASRRYLDSVLAQIGVSLTPQIELGSLELLVDFTRGNLGIAAVTREFLIPDPSLTIIETVPPIPPRSVGVVLKKNSAMTSAVKAFMDLVKADMPHENA